MQWYGSCRQLLRPDARRRPWDLWDFPSSSMQKIRAAWDMMIPKDSADSIDDQNQRIIAESTIILNKKASTNFAQQFVCEVFETDETSDGRSICAHSPTKGRRRSSEAHLVKCGSMMISSSRIIIITPCCWLPACSRKKKKKKK